MKLVFLLSLFLPLLLSFDTGEHFDITYQVLNEQGFSPVAIQVVQVSNWLTDFLSQFPGHPDKEETTKLHFDNRFSTEEINDYWTQFTWNTRNAIMDSTLRLASLETLELLGISTHVVQDFYAHSNWTNLFNASTHPASYFHSIFNLSTIDINTGYTNQYLDDHPEISPTNIQPHGGYSEANGLNKDSYVRPDWSEALVLGYVGTQEWVSAVKGWIFSALNSSDFSQSQIDSFKSSLLNPQFDDRDLENLDDGWEAAYKLSLWVSIPDENIGDGHWKGNGSGDAVAFAAASTEFFISGFANSPFYELLEDDNIHEKLSCLLYDSPLPAEGPGTLCTHPDDSFVLSAEIPEFDPSALRAVVVRIFHFESTSNEAGEPDFFSKVTISNRQTIDATQRSEEEGSPFWTTIQFVHLDEVTIPIEISFWDEDTGNPDDEVDINPNEDKIILNFNFNTETHTLDGDVNGLCDDPGNPCQSEGDRGNRARISFLVTEFALNDTFSFRIPHLPYS